MKLTGDEHWSCACGTAHDLYLREQAGAECAHTCNFSTQETRQENWCKLEASMGSTTRPSLKEDKSPD